MSISEEQLMAYADGEYDTPERAAERSEIEASVRADPELARRVERLRSLRRRLAALHAEVLQEPVPERLVAAVRAVRTTPPSADLLDLSQRRQSRQSGTAERARRIGRSLPHWGAMAASLVLGLIGGYFAWSLREPDLITASGGQLAARSSLERALNLQTAGQQVSSDSVRIGLSFKSKSDEYCRTFIVQQRESLGGLACHHGQQWRIDALARTDSTPGSTGAFRPAGSELPDSVRAIVEAQIAGDPLDAGEEALARQHDWN